MSEQPDSILNLLKNRIDLKVVPFTERGSRLLVQSMKGGLLIRLAERWMKVDPRISAYRERPPLCDNFFFTDANGNKLDFQLESYPHRLDFHTSVGTFSMTFEDTETLLLTLPERSCGLMFQVNVNEARTDRRGGVLRVTGAITRTLAYTTNRPIEVNSIQKLDEGNVQVNLVFAAGEPAGMLINLTPRLGFNRYVPDIQTTFDAVTRRWESWFNSVPPVTGVDREQYYYAWYIMRAGLISSRYFTTRESMTPSKTHYVGIWQWDAYFHALAYRHIDLHLAQDQLRIMTDHQRQDGMIPDAVHDEGSITHLSFPINADVTKPPLLAWSAWKLYETSQDKEFVAELYDSVAAWNNWWFSDNDIDGDGLCEYQHPFSSGLDDSPLWDQGMPVTSPDLNTYLYLQLESLQKMADVLGLEEESRQWELRASELLQTMVNELWDAENGIFRTVYQGLPVAVSTPFSFFPLLTGKLPAEIAGRLVENLQTPDTFWTRYPLPTVAKNDPKYDPMQMWRGPTWINVNYLMVEGLYRSGYPQVARELRRRTLEMVRRLPDIYEYYHPETGEAPPKSASTFGWSAALFIELALQEEEEKQKAAEAA
jgi:hypothetical protein